MQQPDDEDAAALLVLLRDEWVMFVEARLPWAYLMKAGKKLRRVPRPVADVLIASGEVRPRGPDAYDAPLDELLNQIERSHT